MIQYYVFQLLPEISNGLKETEINYQKFISYHSPQLFLSAKCFCLFDLLKDNVLSLPL